MIRINMKSHKNFFDKNMGRNVIIPLALSALIMLPACNKTQGESSSKISKEPPAFQIDCMSKNSKSIIKLTYGTASWFCDNGDGTQSNINVAARHPLDSNLKNIVPTVQAECYPINKQDSFFAELRIDSSDNPNPDEVYIRRWSGECMDDFSAEGEVVYVERSENGSWQFEMKYGHFVYEVLAMWNEGEVCGGNASYIFYTDISE